MVPAPPCVHLPAPPATHVRAAGHAVRVCGRGVVIRGADKASAAGNRIATVHTRRRDVVIRVYRVGRRVTRRRTFVRRVRAHDAAVLLTRTELAWFLAHDDYVGEVAVYRRGRVRIVSRYAAIRPGLEDGRTLRWSDRAGYYSYL